MAAHRYQEPLKIAENGFAVFADTMATLHGHGHSEDGSHSHWRLRRQATGPLSFLMGAFCTLVILAIWPSSNSNPDRAFYHWPQPRYRGMQTDALGMLPGVQRQRSFAAAAEGAAQALHTLSGAAAAAAGSAQSNMLKMMRADTPLLLPVTQSGKLLGLPWQPVLTQAEVERAFTYYGSGARMQALAAKLLAGKPIKAFALGGSVTFGKGASNESMNYASQFFNFINTTFPHRDHVLSNKGMGATNSGIFTACTEHLVDQDADLVILEFSINEHEIVPFTDPKRKGYEQLVRKVLGLPRQPAVIQLHHYTWWHPNEGGTDLDIGVYYETRAEMQLTLVAQYYDLPSISLRGAIYPLLRAGPPGFKSDRVVAVGPLDFHYTKLQPAPNDTRPDYFYYDRTHPGDGGHRVLAELVSSVVLRAVGEVDAGYMPTNRAIASVWTVPSRDEDLIGVMPPPMVEGNEVGESTLCAIQEAFQPMVVAHKGFEYRAEKPQAENFVAQKWGWSAYNPGDWAEMEFDSRDHSSTSSNGGSSNSSAEEGGEPAFASVYLTYLRSYTGGMGTASVSCVSGCWCRGSGIDGTWQQLVSLQQVHNFKVSQHEKCRVRVEVSPNNGTAPQDGHKVVLMGIMVSHFPIRLQTKADAAEVMAARLQAAG